MDSSILSLVYPLKLYDIHDLLLSHWGAMSLLWHHPLLYNIKPMTREKGLD